MLRLNIELHKAEGRNASSTASTLFLLIIQRIGASERAPRLSASVQNMSEKMAEHFYSKPHLNGSQWGAHVQMYIRLCPSLQAVNVSYSRYRKNVFVQLHFWT